MSKTLHGRILNVDTETRGSELDADAAVGATVLVVEDTADFDEDGGWLRIAGSVIEYTGLDDDASTVTLASGLPSAAAEGKPVEVWNDIYGEPDTVQYAEVQVDGKEDQADSVRAAVADTIPELPDGVRGKAAESCTLRRVSDDEWEITAVGGRPTMAKGTKFEADDFYVLAAADITAGTATFPLSHRPAGEGLVAFWTGEPQEPTEYTVNYDAKTITWPLSGFERAGDRLWVHYAYQAGVVAASAEVTRAITIQMISNSHADDLALTFVMPDGSRYAVPGVNTGGAGPVVEFGNFVLENMTIEFKDNTTAQTWVYPPDTSHIHRDNLSGTDTRGPYIGYRYSFDDGGGATHAVDGDFNDIIMDVKAYDA